MIFCDDDDMDISSFCVKHDMTHAHFNMVRKWFGRV